MPSKRCESGCVYSRSMDQPYPRNCVRCGHSESPDPAQGVRRAAVINVEKCSNCGAESAACDIVETAPGNFIGPLCQKCVEYAMKVKKCRETPGRCTCGVHVTEIND